VLKLNADGNVAWENTYGGDDDDGAHCIQQTFDGKYIMVGETQSFGSGSNDVYVLRLDHNGDIPGCSGQSNVIVSGTSSLPGSAGVNRVETAAISSNTNATAQITGAKKSVICETKIQAEIIGSWSSGIRYWDEAKSKWTTMWSNVPSGDIAAGDFSGDGKADVASNWSSGLWYQNAATLGWTKLSDYACNYVTVGDMTGDGRAELIGSWSGVFNGIYYGDFVTKSWTKMWSNVPSGDIAAGDFTGDGKADVAANWSSGLWYQNGATRGWNWLSDEASNNLTVGDVTGDGRVELIGSWDGVFSGIYYGNFVTKSWTQMYSGVPSGDIAAGDFTGDGRADVASCWDSGLWYQNGANLGWTKIHNTAPYRVTAGDVTGD
jgi:hypothetical protein